MTKWSDAEINAIIQSLEKDMDYLSDGFGYYAGDTDEAYNHNMRKVARHILSSIEKARKKMASSEAD